jgi:hypothetical protein
LDLLTFGFFILHLIWEVIFTCSFVVVIIIGVVSSLTYVANEGHGVLMLSRWLSLPALLAGICVHVFRYQRTRDQNFFEKSNVW